MSRPFPSYLDLVVGAAIIAGIPALAHTVVAEGAIQQPAPQDPAPPPQGTKGSVAAGAAKDAARTATDQTGDALDKSGKAVAQAAEATKDAVVSGAKKTKDVVVNVPEKIDETWITAKIAGKINADDALEDVDVDVKVKRNVVTITGEVPTAVLRDRVLRIARETQGVAQVIDRMTVRATTP